MKRSSERFLTTHTGSLPRPDDLVRTMYAREEGVPVDAAALDARIAAAVAEVVGKQAKAGIDVVNDGEMSKPSYATYIKDRLAGFGGTGNTFVYQDLAAVPRGKASLVVAHTATVPPADIRVNGSVLFENIGNGDALTRTVPVATYKVTIVPTGETEPVVLGRSS